MISHGRRFQVEAAVQIRADDLNGLGFHVKVMLDHTKDQRSKFVNSGKYDGWNLREECHSEGTCG